MRVGAHRRSVNLACLIDESLKFTLSFSSFSPRLPRPMDESEIFRNSSTNQLPRSTRPSPLGGGRSSTTSIHITALDGIVNVNSLFTLAIFLGLAWNPSSDPELALGRCAAGNRIAEDLVSFHVFAFAAFLFSSLVALCLKEAVRILHPRHGGGLRARVNRGVLRAGIVASAVGSVVGCGCLMMALVNLVQIKLGRLGCSAAAAGAVVPLVTLVPAGMLVYSATIFYAFTR